MALPANALTTMAAACGELALDVPASGSATEADLERRIGAASDAIEKHCGRKFGRAAGIVEKVPGYGGEVLFLSRVPLVSVASVTYDGDAVTATEYDATPSESDAEMGLLRRASDADVLDWYWTASQRAGSDDKQAGTERRLYTVTYTAGYILPMNATVPAPRALPYDVERACLLTVAADYLAKGRDEAISSETVLGNTTSYTSPGGNTAIGRSAGALPDKAIQLLRPYGRTT